MKKRSCLFSGLLLLGAIALSSCDIFPTNPDPSQQNQDEYVLVLKDFRQDLYKVGEVYDDFVGNRGLKVYRAVKTNQNILFPISEDSFTYVLKNSTNKLFDSSHAFVTPGQYTVTVSSEGYQDASMRITVSKEETPQTYVTNIEIPQTKYTLNVNETVTVNAVVKPDNASNKNLLWTSDNEGIATVKNGVIKGISQGNTVVSVSATDGSNVSKDIQVEVNSSGTSLVPVSRIEMDENDTVEVGKTKQLNYKIYPENATNKTLSWVSKYPSGVSVDQNGVVTGLTEGKYAYIEATATDGSGVSNSCKVTVTKASQTSVSVTGVSLSPTSKTINVNEGFNLTPTISPSNATNKNVSYSSSNTNIATVSTAGYVKGVASGSATITVRTSDGNYTATCNVTVNAASTTVNVTGLTINPTSKTIKVNENFTIVPTISPSNATNKNVTYSSASSSIATVSDSGVVNGVSIGTTTITVKTVDGNISKTCTVTVESSGTIAASGTISIGVDDLLTSYDASGSITVYDSNNISVQFNTSNVANYSNGVQFKASVSYVSNKNALNIRSIQLVEKSGSRFSGSLYWGTSANPSSNQVTATEGQTYENPGNYTYFKLIKDTKGAGYLDEIIITVGAKEEINPTAISIPTSTSLSINETKTLSVTYTPSNANQNKEIIWSSSDNNVVSVTNGQIQGINAGTATITAKLSFDNYIKATCTVTVSKIAVSSISLTESSISVSKDSTHQLNYTISPSNASDKTVTWTSSNSAVATVSNDGVVTGVKAGTANITVKTTDGNKTASCSVTVSEQTKDAWTILMYVCGADLESDYADNNDGLATGDFDEITSVSGQPNNVNIVMQTGGAKKWSSEYGISAAYNQRYHVANRNLVCDNSKVYSTYQSMGLSSTLKDFISWGLKAYPAEKTGLVLWNHGGGLRGVCYDEKKSDDSLTNSEILSAVSGALSASGISGKLEFIGFDACLMQVQDIAEFMSPYFNYMVASEESEAGYGWDYDTWVDDLYANKPTTTILKAICDGFIKDNGGTTSTKNDQTLSYLNLAYASEYMAAWEEMATALISKFGSSVSAKTFASWVLTNVKHYADDDYNYFHLFDAKDFVNKLGASVGSSYNPGSTYTQNVLSKFSSFVEYSTCGRGAGNSNGLCMVYVYTQDRQYTTINNYYTTSQTHFTNWRTFNTKYGDLK